MKIGLLRTIFLCKMELLRHKMDFWFSVQTSQKKITHIYTLFIFPPPTTTLWPPPNFKKPKVFTTNNDENFARMMRESRDVRYHGCVNQNIRQ